MSTPAKGDLAQVTEQHCPAAAVIGYVVTVGDIEPAHPTMYLRCPACKQTYAHGEQHALVENLQLYHPLRWLRRIPPPGELGIVDEKTEEPSHVG
jgi:hypothetical protein